jgi:hypothetical protein
VKIQAEAQIRDITCGEKTMPSSCGISFETTVYTNAVTSLFPLSLSKVGNFGHRIALKYVTLENIDDSIQ